MGKYLFFVLIIRFIVDYMLIMAAGRLFVQGGSWVRAMLAGGMGCVYTVLVLMPQLPVLRTPIGYCLSLVLTAIVAFGWCPSAVAQGIVFFLLRLGLDGLCAERGGFLKAISLMLLCGVFLYSLSDRRHFPQLIPVQLSYRGRELKLQALWDSGHTLRDPVTGNAVLIVGSDVADQLTGLTAQQLKTPVETMGAVPGLRLIPYQTVDSSGNMLLALQVNHVKIGKKQGSYLVAFAPQVLDRNGKFQALIGGSV